MARQGLPRLLLAVTGHGYGHLSQTAPVVAALPPAQLLVRCTLPAPILERFLGPIADISRPVADFGMAMTSPFDVDRTATRARYAELHADWDGAVAAEAAALTRLAPDLVIANVSYLALAAAARAGIPAVGLCSLDWLHTYEAFFGWDRIAEEMQAAYASARLFLCPAPAMPMPRFPTEPIGPLARRGRQQPLGPGRHVLVSLGGIEGGGLDLAAWPRVDGITYVIAGGAAVPDRPDMRQLALDHLDCLASADALVSKPGYGSMVEAACHGVPIIYAPRFDWPEEPSVLAWLAEHAVAEPISRGDLTLGHLPLDQLWSRPRRPPVEATGARDAARRLTPFL